MKQVWNIFWKDARHYWREGAASAALLAAFGWNEARGWGEGLIGVDATSGGLFNSHVLGRLVVVLVPIAWALIVVRAVQGEALVGDRQFWVTRPYEWKKLLAAKVLFVLTVVNLPLLILDVALLAKAGFAPTGYVSGLLWMQVMMTLYFLLPTAVLATVTATIAQLLLALLLIVLYVIGLGMLSEYIPSSGFSGSLVDYLAGTLFLVCVSVLLLQYARRRTGQSRALIGGLAGVFVLILVFTPYRTIVAREFPPLDPGQQVPFQLALEPAEENELGLGPRREGNDIQIRLPFAVSGVGAESIVQMDGFLVEVEAADGWRWNSDWKSSWETLLPERKSTQIDFAMKKSIFERMQSSAVKIRLAVAYTLFHDGKRREFVTPTGEFRMEDVGLCSATSYTRAIHCLAPLRRPSSLLISADMALSTCPVVKGESPAIPGEMARYWVRGESAPAEFGISSVQSIDLNLQDSNWEANRRSAGICLGTPLVLSNPEVVRQNQTALEMDGIRLEDYRLGPPHAAGKQ
jgi:hypothetical protein